jgi:hypothetical protein
MKRQAYLSVSIALLAVGAVLIARRLTSASRASSVATSPSRSAASGIKARAVTAYGHLPLHFEANQGQTDAQVKFLARGIGHTLFLTDREAVLVFTKTDPPAKRTPEQRALTIELVLRMTLVGANPASRVRGLEPLPGKANYFIGRDPTQWHTNVPLYAKVQYADLYPGIDLSYSGEQRQLAYEFVVSPGADPNRIALRWLGIDSLALDAQGDLVLHTPWGAVRQMRPVIYQELDGARRVIAGDYVRAGRHRAGFELAAYDASRPLVITGTVPFASLPSTVAATTVAGPFDLAHLFITSTR